MLHISLQDLFKFVKEVDDQHCWLTAFRYDIAVRQIVVGHHVNGCPQDPSLKRPEQVEIAKNQTETLRDGFDMRHRNPYARGQKWEHKNPITGKWYTEGQSHDNLGNEEDTVEEDYIPKGKIRANNFWKSRENALDDNNTSFRGRGNRCRSFRGRRLRSPYQKDDREVTYEERAFNDKGKSPAQSTSKSKDKDV
ncbi:uncharacterized protein MELLADRAFT_103635 [Melampsora larici-populina 98AG31]|uniref:Uncharacterized protein n=1 Tax=Melampsora larici-populina (strain 98AG31 / pathotype 3-4-7) TaxID=747676 RepID=F4RBZ2_MELLP|nr:uncharacterized protein MELLADRAFT_103635 [Melampsora larici-populina 98AG31]EGG10254.1 hypothetical protein MELLADRAFT_103635 [Melampsora larici-populina 98AG31]